MKKKVRELLNLLDSKKAEAKAAYEDGNIEQGDSLKGECETINNQIKGLNALDDIEDSLPQDDEPLDPTPVEPKARSGFEIVRAFLKGDRSSSDVIKNISTIETEGEQSVSLIIPQDIQTEIVEQRRQYKDMKQFIGNYPTTTLSGTYPVEDTSTMTDLVDFDDDGNDLSQSEDPKFKAVSYKIKFRGSWLPISNILRQVAPKGFINYLSRWWNKKAIRTENKIIFAALKKGKTAVAIKGLDDLKRTVNVELDPEFLNVIMVTNQDGYNYLDTLKDSDGKSIINPDPMQKDRKLFKGLYPIEVFSNKNLPSVSNKAPIFIGDLVEASDFVEFDGGLQLATSEHAEFKKNRMLMRVVTGYDVTQKDVDAYVYGEIDLSVTPVQTSIEPMSAMINQPIVGNSEELVDAIKTLTDTIASSKENTVPSQENNEPTKDESAKASAKGK